MVRKSVFQKIRERDAKILTIEKIEASEVSDDDNSEDMMHVKSSHVLSQIQAKGLEKSRSSRQARYGSNIDIRPVLLKQTNLNDVTSNTAFFTSE